MTYGFNAYDYGQQMQQMLNQQAQAQNQANHSAGGQLVGAFSQQQSMRGGGNIFQKLQGLSQGQLPIGGMAGQAGNQIMKLLGGLFG